MLYAHAPLLAELGPGEVTLHGGDVGDQHLFVAQGFVEVLPDRVTILAESAIPPSEINVAEARQELEHGQKMWHEAGDEARRYDEANRVIREAEERIASAGRAGKSGLILSCIPLENARILFPSDFSQVQIVFLRVLASEVRRVFCIATG